MPPEKIAVVEQLQKELGGRSSNHGSPIALNNIDPILVGEHVVFDNKWLEYIGQGKPLTPQKFEIWRNKVDKTFESYVELTGGTPAGGEKIFIDLRLTKDFANKNHSGHAHTMENVICINRDAFIKSTLQEIASHGSADKVVMHEMAHIFAKRKAWEIDIENITHVLMSYAMETNKFQYGGIPRNASIFLQKTVENQHRLRRYQVAIDSYKANKIEDFNTNNCAYIFYTMGLVDKVGWDAYKQTFRSYNDKGFIPNKYESVGNSKVIRTRDFLDRIEYFSGKPGVLRTLLDKGALLDKYFSPQVVQQNLGATPNESIMVKSSPKEPPQTDNAAERKSIPVPGGRTFVNASGKD